MYEYSLDGKTIRLKQYTPPFQFDEGEQSGRPEFYDLSGVWTKERGPQKQDAGKVKGDMRN